MTWSQYHDCHTHLDYNYCSVPFRYVDKDVEINLTEKLLKISYQGKEIVTNLYLSGRGNFFACKSHYPAYKCYCDTKYQEKYQAKMANIGRYAEQLLLLILKEHPRDWNRTITGILSLTKRYPTDV